MTADGPGCHKSYRLVPLKKGIMSRFSSLHSLCSRLGTSAAVEATTTLQEASLCRVAMRIGSRGEKD